MAAYGVGDCPGFASLHAATHIPLTNLVVMYGIPRSRIYRFTTQEEFKEDLERCEDAFISGDGEQYIAFREVQQSDLRLIAHGSTRSELPEFRFLYDPAEEVTIVKLKDGQYHEVAGGGFGGLFLHKLALLEATLDHFGSTPYVAPNGRSKEPDDSWAPSDRDAGIDLRSLVIELGVSDSLVQLRMDAHHWRTQRGGQNRVVIILAVNRGSKLMTIERWELARTTRPTRASVAPGIPTQIQLLTLYDNGTVDGGPLLIPASKVYDTLTPGLGQNDFTFTNQELTQYIQQYWAMGSVSVGSAELRRLIRKGHCARRGGDKWHKKN